MLHILDTHNTCPISISLTWWSLKQLRHVPTHCSAHRFQHSFHSSQSFVTEKTSIHSISTGTALSWVLFALTDLPQPNTTHHQAQQNAVTAVPSSKICCSLSNPSYCSCLEITTISKIPVPSESLLTTCKELVLPTYCNSNAYIAWLFIYCSPHQAKIPN